jgi:Oxidoreductase family, NAD-binding Rossmann fold
MVRIAVLGCGRIGVMHAANRAAHPRAILEGVCDIHAPTAGAVSKKTGAAAFTSAQVIGAAFTRAVGFGYGRLALVFAEAALKPIAGGRAFAAKEIV